MTLAIEARSLEKRYGTRPVLCGVDLDVRGGEVFCLLGPNGAVPRPGGVLALLLGLGLGPVCLGALALAVSAAIPSAETAGPVTLASYLPFAILSGVFSTTLVLPGWLNRGLEGFPVMALVDVLRAGYAPGPQRFPAAGLAVLAAWSLIGAVLARRFFRWQP